MHPEWLYKSIIESDFDWENVKQINFDYFHEKYTLHDSLWIGSFVDNAYEDTCILAFELDWFWLPDEEKEVNKLKEGDNVYVFFIIKGFKRMELSSYKYDPQSVRIVGKSEYSIIGEEKVFVVTDIFGGETDFIYTNEVNVFTLNQDKMYLNIF